MTETTTTAPPWVLLGGGLAIRESFDDSLHMIELSGELDAAVRASTVRACTSIGHVRVVVDMADLTFMDCAGYGALVASRAVLERGGGSLTLLDPRGEPLRLLALVELGEHSAVSAFRRASSATLSRSAGPSV